MRIFAQRRRRPCTMLLAALALHLGCCAPARADSGTEQVALAASGRYDQLESLLEAQQKKAPLATPDLHGLCFAYSKLKRYTQLMSCLDQLSQSLKSGSKRSRLFGLDDATPSLNTMRAEALVELAQYPAAAAVAKQNLDWLKANPGDMLDMEFDTLALLSMAQTLSGDAAGGDAVARRIAATSTGLFGNDFVSAKAIALARARMALGQYPGVIEALNADRLFAVNVFLDRLVSGGFLTGTNNWVWIELPRAFMMSKALLETGRLAQAKQGFDRLLSISQARENGEIYWLLLNDRGRIAEQENDRAAALGYYRQAIEIVELQRASINTEASKIGFVGDKQALYMRAVKAALALDNTALAFDYMERAKSRALVDLLAARSTAMARNGADPASGSALAGYFQAADEAAVQLPLNMARTGGDSRSAVASKAMALKKINPDLASLVSVDAMPLADIRASLRPDEVLVEYFRQGQELIVVGISNDRIQSASMPAEPMDAAVRTFRTQIEALDPQALAAGQALYEKLIRPLEKMLAGRNLLIVPHGVLHYLPFAALHDGSDYLANRHSLRFLPSASIQKYLRPDSKVALSKVLIFANPDIGRPDADLPSAEDEARIIFGMVPDSKILARAQASESSFKRDAASYPYLHVAAHGQFYGDQPLLSRLLLAPDQANDGPLTVSEVYDLRLNAEMVTLSACETGLSKAMNGDDLIGLIRGFLYAGSSNVVASLWQVDDAATSEMMQQFYRNILAGMSKQAALRHAQTSLQKKFPQPYYWAAFYLTGRG